MSRCLKQCRPPDQRRHSFLDDDLFLQYLRTSRRGVAAGPSGMNSDHLFPLLDSERDSMKFYEFAFLLARGEVPGEVMEILRMGRIAALSKPDGGVRGITVGDILRRLVARTIAQQYSKRVEIATAPFQCALSTRVGCECIAHVIQTLTGIDEEATVVSIDGVGAFDLISRNAMLQALLEIDGGDQIMPFVRQLYGRPSTHLSEDEMGEVHEIAQGEGGERPVDATSFQFGTARCSGCCERQVGRRREALHIS